MDQHNATPDTQERSSVGRRTVLKGAAWSVPVVAVVGATPAFANSVLTPLAAQSPLVVSRSGTGGTYVWTVKNPDAQTVKITSVSVSEITITGRGITASPTTATILTGATTTITFTMTGGASNTDAMPGFTFSVAYEEEDGYPSSSGSWTVSAGSVKNSKTENWTLTGSTYSDPTP